MSRQRRFQRTVDPGVVERGLGLRRADQQHDLALGCRLPGVLRGEFRQGATPDLLEFLGEFARNCSLPSPVDYREIDQCFGDPVRRLKKHQRGRHMLEFARAATAFTGFIGQEPLEKEAIARQAGEHQPHQHRRSPRRRRELVASLDDGLDELVAGVGDQRRACVGNQRQCLPLAQLRQDQRTHLAGIVLVVGHDRRRDAVMREENLGHTLVLSEDQICRRQRGKRPQRDITEVADRCRDDMQAGLNPLRFRRQPEHGEFRRFHRSLHYPRSLSCRRSRVEIPQKTSFHCFGFHVGMLCHSLRDLAKGGAHPSNGACPPAKRCKTNMVCKDR